MMSKENLAAGEYQVWSPYDSHEAAAILLNLLEDDKMAR